MKCIYRHACYIETRILKSPRPRDPGPGFWCLSHGIKLDFLLARELPEDFSLLIIIIIVCV